MAKFPPLQRARMILTNTKLDLGITSFPRRFLEPFPKARTRKLSLANGNILSMRTYISPFSPRCVRFGLYAEQMTASAFVAPRHVNKKAWLTSCISMIRICGKISLIISAVTQKKLKSSSASLDTKNWELLA